MCRQAPARSAARSSAARKLFFGSEKTKIRKIGNRKNKKIKVPNFFADQKLDCSAKDVDAVKSVKAFVRVDLHVTNRLCIPSLCDASSSMKRLIYLSG